VRYETSTNRQLQKDIAQLERLQEKRKAQSASLDAPESDENETDAQPDDPTPADGGNAGSSAIVVPLNESKAEENLDAVATPAETENAETKPTVTELRNEVSAEQNTGENHEPPKDAQRRKDIENDGNEASPSTFARLITEACHLDP